MVCWEEDRGAGDPCGAAEGGWDPGWMGGRLSLAPDKGTSRAGRPRGARPAHQPQPQPLWLMEVTVGK